MKIEAAFRPDRVVILRPRGLGDVVLSSAVIDAVSRAYPEAGVDYLTEKPALAFLETDERIDRVFLLGKPRRPGRDVRTGGMADAIAWMRRPRPDLVLDLLSSPRTELLTASSRARFRVGTARSARRFAYNLRVRGLGGPLAGNHRYVPEAQLDLLRRVGVSWSGEARVSLFLTAQDRAAADDAIAGAGYAPGARFGGVLPGGSWESKRWTVEGFVAVGRDLAERFGQPTLVIWGPPEREDAERIREGLGEHGRMAPPLSLRGMAALLGRPALLVSTDCLGRHLSVIQAVPTLGIFGSTDPRDWTPRTGPHRTVDARAEEGGPALKRLPPGPVLAEAARFWADGTLDASRPRA